MENKLGELLRSLRGEMSLREAAELSGVSHTYIRSIELGLNRSTNAPISPSPDTLLRLSKAYDYPYTELMKAAGYFEGVEENMKEIAEKAAVDKHEGRPNPINDAIEKKKWKPELTDKDERDIGLELDALMSQLEGSSSPESNVNFYGEPMSDEDKELLRAALNKSLHIAKQMSKERFTPKKYRK